MFASNSCGINDNPRQKKKLYLSIKRLLVLKKQRIVENH